MKDNKYQFLIYILIISFFKCSFQLICPPDHFRTKDYYWSENDYENKEKTYGFNFNYRYGSIQYNDFWSGIVYQKSFVMKFIDQEEEGCSEGDVI